MESWISSFQFGSITISGRTYDYDVMVTWHGKVKQMQLAMRHVFGEEELMQLIAERPDVIVVGTGTHGCVQLSPEVASFAEKNRIKLVDVPTKDAIKEFTQLKNSGKKVVAFMHVTC